MALTCIKRTRGLGGSLLAVLALAFALTIDGHAAASDADVLAM